MSRFSHLRGGIAHPTPDEKTRERARFTRWAVGSAVLNAPAPVLQTPSRWQRMQRWFGTCGCQSASHNIETVFPEMPRASAADIFHGAWRRMGGDIRYLDHGTKWPAIAEELEHRGWDNWEPGEDTRESELGKNTIPAGDNLRDEMRAADRRCLVRIHYLDGIEDLRDALAAGAGCSISTGTRDAFDDLAFDEVATTKHLGGSSGGHAMAIIGIVMVNGRYQAILANWWDTPKATWGGCAVEGLMLPGHCRADESVIRNAWHLTAMTRK